MCINVYINVYLAFIRNHDVHVYGIKQPFRESQVTKNKVVLIIDTREDLIIYELVKNKLWKNEFSMLVLL